MCFNLSSKCDLSDIGQFYFLIQNCWQFDTRQFGIIRTRLRSSHSHPRVTGWHGHSDTETVITQRQGGSGAIQDHWARGAGNGDVSQTRGPINIASSSFLSSFQIRGIFRFTSLWCDVMWPGPEWQPGANSEMVRWWGGDHWEWGASLTPAPAPGHGKQIGSIWNFIAQMMTLTRSVEHHQIQIKPDFRSHTLVVIPKNLKNISWSWSSDARSRCFQSLIIDYPLFLEDDHLLNGESYWFCKGEFGTVRQASSWDNCMIGVQDDMS